MTLTVTLPFWAIFVLLAMLAVSLSLGLWIRWLEYQVSRERWKL